MLTFSLGEQVQETEPVEHIGQRRTGAKSPGSIGNKRRHFIHHISTICQLRRVLNFAKPRVVNMDGSVGISIASPPDSLL